MATKTFQPEKLLLGSWAASRATCQNTSEMRLRLQRAIRKRLTWQCKPLLSQQKAQKEEMGMQAEACQTSSHSLAYLSPSEVRDRRRQKCAHPLLSFCSSSETVAPKVKIWPGYVKASAVSDQLSSDEAGRDCASGQNARGLITASATKVPPASHQPWHQLLKSAPSL